VAREVLIAVSEAENRAWESPPPLADVVDPDGLNGLFESGDVTDGDGHAPFAFTESVVSTAYGDYIRVEERDAPRSPDSDTFRGESLDAAIDLG
jgi:hypothetical protein